MKVITIEERKTMIENTIEEMITAQDMLMCLPPKPWAGKINAKSYEIWEKKYNDKIKRCLRKIEIQTQQIAKSIRED
jgi:hypothetical protein